MRVTKFLCKSCLTLALGHAAWAPLAAAPFIPAHGDQVLEEVPMRDTGVHREIRQLRKALAASPRNLTIAANLARRHIALSRETGDPRYLGYAQAALATWWALPDAPPAVRLLRASVLQTRHQFADALSDLDAVIQPDPRNAEAWLMRASILQVRAEYQAARSACTQLAALTTPLIVTTCLAGSDAVGADAGQSYEKLTAMLEQHAEAPAAIKTWVLTLLGEIAARRGMPVQAQAHFRDALALSDGDSYLLAAYADFLLDADRNQEVIALLGPHARVDALLLRYAIAMKRSRSPGLASHVAALQSRFDAAKMRGDTSHEREQALFELHLRNNPGAALIHASNNWADQKEFTDARILLEAAAASRNTAAAQPAIRWLRETGLQTALLDAPLSKLGVK